MIEAAVGVYCLLCGTAILALWGYLIRTRQVPELQAGRKDIWFHLPGELVTAMLLLIAGTALLAAGDDVRARLLAMPALGALPIR